MVDAYAIPLDFRTGGMLVAMPHDILSPQTIADGQDGAEDALFGPNSFFTAPLVEEAEDLSTISLGFDAKVIVVDVSDSILRYCREYDPVTDSMASIYGFSLGNPSSLPDCTVLHGLVSEWLLQLLC